MKLIKCLLLCCCLILAFVYPVHAVIPTATFNVNTTTDSVDSNPGDGTCADAGGNCSLRAAIMEANALSLSIVTINVPAGTYNLTIISGAEEDASASNDLDITNTGMTTIAGTGYDSVIINATNIAHRAFDVIAGGKLTLNNLTITGGYSSVAGGGIRVASGATLNLERVRITNNQSVLGGGIYNAGTITGNLVSITSNSASESGACGGGIYLAGNTNNSVSLTRSLIAQNHSDGYGGGVCNWGNGSYSSPVGGNLYLENVTIGHNSADSNGAGVVLNSGSRSYFVNCTIAYNTNAVGYSGAGVAGWGANSFDFLNTLVFQNTGYGGVNNCYQIWNSSSSLKWPGLNDAYFVKGVPYGHNLNDPYGGSNDQSVCFPDGVSSNILLDAGLTTDTALAEVGTYRLKTGSAAIDAGDSSTYPALDVFGTSRPQGTAPDVGAHEFTSDNEPPSVPTLTSPSNGSTVYGTSATLYWQKSTDPEGGQVIYILQIAEDINFTTNLRQFYVDENGTLLPAFLLPLFGLLGWFGRKRGKKYLIGLTAVVLLTSSLIIGCSGGSGSGSTIGDENTISYQVSNLEEGKTYYWRVIAQDEENSQSDPSEVRSFTVK